MSTANLHVVFGRLGTDPELKGQGDKCYVATTVATEEYAKGKGPIKDGKPTDFVVNWHRVIAFGAQAKYIAEKFKKGDYIHLEGPIEVKTYEKKEFGTNKVIDPNAIQVRMIVRVVAGVGTKQAPKTNGVDRAAATPDQVENDIPF